MEENRFQIKSRIFKRERVRENTNNLIVVAKRKENVNKNQIELSFDNPGLETNHLMIVGRVVMKEWERVLEQYPVTRSFIQVRQEQQVRFYISFQVDNDLSSKAIKSIVSIVTTILDECLEKVCVKAKKALPVRETEVILDDMTKERNDQELVSANNELIEQLHQEIEEQENLLKKLAIQQDKLKQPIFEDEDILVTTPETVIQDTHKDEMITVLSMQVTSLNKEIERLNHQVEQSKAINIELDKANLKLNDVVQQNKVDEERLLKAKKQEKDLQKIKQENSDYRIQLNESQHMIEQYKNSNNHLNESLTRLEMTHDELIEKAQFDINKLELEIKEAEKKNLIEVNNRQKLEIELDELQVKLAHEIRSGEKQDNRIKQLNLDVSRQLKQREVVTTEKEELEEEVSKLQSELKLSTVSNQILKDELLVLESQKEKWQQIDEWQHKYEELVLKFAELENESLSYRQEIHLLNSQLANLETQLVTETPEESTNNISYSLDLPSEEPKKEVLDEYIWDDEENNYFAYEADPFVEEVITEELMNIRKKDQMEAERDIKDLLECYYEEDYKDIKVDREEYRKHVLNFKFLSFRWSQVFIINESDKNAAFLEWCSTFIEKIESFEEELSFDVKKSFFTKNYVTMDESTYHILKGFSLLSTYLDTYYLKVSYYIDKYFLNEGNRGNNAK